jgi:hypothetical protein
MAWPKSAASVRRLHGDKKYPTPRVDFHRGVFHVLIFMF